jgi:hypothetical protein
VDAGAVGVIAGAAEPKPPVVVPCDTFPVRERKVRLIQMVDPLARGLAIYAAVIGTAGIGWQVFIWTRSGGHLRVRRLTLKKHPSDPRQHRVVVRLVNTGHLPVKVTELGIRDHAGKNQSPYIRLPVPPTDGGDRLPRTLQHGDAIVAEVLMTAIMERWFPDGRILLSGWARTADDRLRSGSTWAPLVVKTPPE